MQFARCGVQCVVCTLVCTVCALVCNLIVCTLVCSVLCALHCIGKVTWPLPPLSASGLVAAAAAQSVLAINVSSLCTHCMCNCAKYCCMFSVRIQVTIHCILSQERYSARNFRSRLSWTNSHRGGEAKITIIKDHQSTSSVIRKYGSSRFLCRCNICN